jgi:hypothetical protein
MHGIGAIDNPFRAERSKPFPANGFTAFPGSSTFMKRDFDFPPWASPMFNCKQAKRLVQSQHSALGSNPHCSSTPEIEKFRPRHVPRFLAADCSTAMTKQFPDPSTDNCED